MIVYEFWLKDEFQSQAFEALVQSFYTIGGVFKRRVDGHIITPDFYHDGSPHPDAGKNHLGPAVYSVSRNVNTHWVQLLVDENTPQPIITAIEARINGLKDNEPLREYGDDAHYEAPIETPKHFTLERVLRVRQKQKDRTLGRIEDVA